MAFKKIPAMAVMLSMVVVAQAQDISVRPAGGVTFANADKSASLSLGGRMQLRHTYQDIDGAPDLNNFNTPRIRLALKGNVHEWDWEFQSDFANRNSTTLKDGFVSRKIGDDVSVRFGQFKVGYDRQQLESSGRQTFVDRNIASGFFGKGRDLGVMVNGRAMDRVLQYNVGVFNGGGEGQPNNNSGNMVVGRLSVNPLGDFGMSQGDLRPSAAPRVFVDVGSYFSQDEAASGDGELGVAVGAGFRMAGVYVAGEYFLRETSAELKSNGFFAQAGYMIVPEFLEVAGRYAQVDPDTDVGSDLRTEIMGGFNVYFNRLGHGLKLNTDVALLKNEANDQDDLRTRAQFQIVF